jgi:hypothetical protein
MVDPAKLAAVGYCFGGTVDIELVETGVPLLGFVSVHGSFRNFAPEAGKNIKGRVLIEADIGDAGQADSHGLGTGAPEAVQSLLPLSLSFSSRSALAWASRLYPRGNSGVSAGTFQIGTGLYLIRVAMLASAI